MQLIAIALPSTTPRPAMPMNSVRSQGRSDLSVIPASIGGADAMSAVAFVRPAQAGRHLKEVIVSQTPTRRSTPRRRVEQVTNAAVASPDYITNPILRSIILGVAFFVVIPVFWVIIVLPQRNQGRA